MEPEERLHEEELELDDKEEEKRWANVTGLTNTNTSQTIPGGTPSRVDQQTKLASSINASIRADLVSTIAALAGGSWILYLTHPDSSHP